MIKAVLIVVAALMLAWTGEVAAQDGRYQAIVIPPGREAPDMGHVLLLDTREGHVWRWWLSPSRGKEMGGGGITYEGKLTPGAKPGDIVQQYRFSE
jgi:hypothetical protein